MCCGLRGHHMNHAIVIVTQITQESRQHGCGLRPGVVKQDDAPAGCLQPIGDQLQLPTGGHQPPVAGPEVGTEYHDAARLQEVEGRRPRFEVGKAKERRARHIGRDTMKRRFDRLDATVDFLRYLVGRDLRQVAVAPGMVSDGVASGSDPAHQRRMFLGRLADQEERRLHALRGQRCQRLLGRSRRWAVIESQHDLMIAERQRLWEVFQPDPRRRGGIDGEYARRAEHPRARARPRPGRSRPREAGHEGRGQELVQFPTPHPPTIFVIALGVAHWVMREA